MFKLGLDELEGSSKPTSLISRKKIIKMGVPPSTFHRWTSGESERTLPTIKINRKVFCTENDWNKWVEVHRR